MQHDAYEIDGPDRRGRWLLTCDHATNRVPDWINGGDLGLDPADMERHIAYDVGAAAVTRVMAEALDSPAILTRFSRLVIDPNRGEADPTQLMRLYDGTIIPANAYADQVERERRLDRLYRPYHAKLGEMAARSPAPAICAIHSFTPQLKGRPPRPWLVSVLATEDRRLADPFFDACVDKGWVTGFNEPYGGYLPGDSIDRHATPAQRPNLLIEIRNDLISDAAGQQEWGLALADILRDIAKTHLP